MASARTLVRLLGRALRATSARATSERRRSEQRGLQQRGLQQRGPEPRSSEPRSSEHDSSGHRPAPSAPARPVGYPGDFTGTLEPVYSPDLDGAPDPGEIVWTWVPYEEDHSRGKDRPVLIVGRDEPWLLGLMLTTRDHDREPGPRDELWVDIGSGSWDVERRPSEVRVDRVIRVDAAAVRREGAVLDRARFDQVAGSLRASRG